jgi:uncharacterized protein YukE
MSSTLNSVRTDAAAQWPGASGDDLQAGNHLMQRWPLPGGVEECRSGAREQAWIADSLHEVIAQVHALAADSAHWTGAASAAFGEVAAQAPKHFGQLEDRLRDTAKTLYIYADRLSVAQYDEHQVRLSLQPVLDELRSIASDDPRYSELMARCKSAVRRYRDVLGQFATDVENAISRLAKAGADDLRNPGRLARIANWTADALGKLSAVLVLLGVACLIFFPAASPVLFALSVACSAIALAGHVYAKANGIEVSWATIAGDALGAIPFGAIGTAAKVGRVAAVASGGSRMAKLGAAGRPMINSLGRSAIETKNAAKDAWFARGTLAAFPGTVLANTMAAPARLTVWSTEVAAASRYAAVAITRKTVGAVNDSLGAIDALSFDGKYTKQVEGAALSAAKATANGVKEASSAVERRVNSALHGMLR